MSMLPVVHPKLVSDDSSLQVIDFQPARVNIEDDIHEVLDGRIGIRQPKQKDSALCLWFG